MSANLSHVDDDDGAQSTIKAETDALGMMEKGGATPADTEPKREMLRELQGKKQKALTKLKELDKSGKKPGKAAAAGPAEIKRQDAPPPQQKRATDAKLPTTRPPTASQPPAAAAEAGSGKSVEQLVRDILHIFILDILLHTGHC
jgi:hypothetical protein